MIAAPPDLRGADVLVTGGLGFIGSNLAHACLRLGADVTVCDSLDPRCGGNEANIAEIADRIRIVRGDIRSPADVGIAMRSARIVFNCAAYTSHPGSMTDPQPYVDVNCGGVITLLEAARRCERPPRVIQIGTSTQVGRMTGDPITEEHAEFPLDVYSATKTLAEKLVLLYGSAHGLPVTVVRLANVYGPRANLTDPGLSFVNYFVGRALQDRDLTVFGDGSQRRSVAYVDDVIDALVQVAVSEACLGTVLFAASDRSHSILRIAETIVQVLGRGRVRSVPWPADRAGTEVGDVIISSARIRRAVGWRATTDLEDGMARTAAYFAPRLAQYVS